MQENEKWPKAYDSSQVEKDIYKHWEESGYFNPDTLPERNRGGEMYSIMMPPPNVTGVLHLGHAMEDTIMDIAVRFQRMRGKKALLLPGTDHAAIATQSKVEKLLMKEGVKYPREELGREKLVEKIREFAENSKSTILSQIRVMGTSCDWSRLAYTLDEARNRAVNELFVRMYKDGLIYRGYRVVNWSIKGQITCSDDEIVYIERPAKLYTFKYSKDFPITIATTRPETKLGDTAVAVHPDDERYKKYVGQTFTVDIGAAKPLLIKIIADESVEKDFGTGALGVTPAHSAVDFTMYEKQKAKNDPIGIVPVIGTDGRMTEAAGKDYVGLTVEEAREKFVSWLKTRGLLESEEDITQNVGTSDRYEDVVESLPMTQWWLDMNREIPGRGKSLRDLMREAVTTGLDGSAEKKIRIMPERIVKEYLDRIDNLRDWCLSRQLWWGHRIPVWYKKQPAVTNDESSEKEMYVGAVAPEGEGWEQDPDTLDTWFSSGSWTFSTLGWPEITEDLKRYQPTSWMQMGYELRYLWMMRMILMHTYVLEEIPFKDCYIHGLLKDEHGKKFSKSSGNGIDPIEVVERYGCDALRLSLILGISPGNDSKFYLEKVEANRNLVNKIWNISRFIVSSTQDTDSASRVEAKTLADKWLLARLAEIESRVTEMLESYQFSQAGEMLRDFTWSDLADWYLEIAKIEKGKEAILRHILETVLKLWHPFMPFVTEYIWGLMGNKDLIVAEWPKDDVLRTEYRETAEFETVRNLVTDIRRLRAEQGVEPAKFIEAGVAASGDDQQRLEENVEVIKHLARLSEMKLVATVPEGWATTISGVITVGINVAGTVDKEKEKAKAEKEIAELKPYITSLQAKLQNEEFTSKAPEKVVQGMKDKLAEAEAKLKALEDTST